MGVTETDVSIVSKYIKEYALAPRLTCDMEDFEIQGYSVWAVEEIRILLLEELMKPPPCVGGDMPKDTIDIIEEYAFKMDMYSELYSEKEGVSPVNLFGVACSTADDLLYFYIHEKRNQS